MTRSEPTTGDMVLLQWEGLRVQGRFLRRENNFWVLRVQSSGYYRTQWLDMHLIDHMRVIREETDGASSTAV